MNFERSAAALFALIGFAVLDQPISRSEISIKAILRNTPAQKGLTNEVISSLEDVFRENR